VDQRLPAVLVARILPVFSAPLFSPIIVPVTSYTISSFTATVASVTFSVNPNFCIVLGENEINLQMDDLVVFPNPANDNLCINIENHFVKEVEIFDVNEKKIKNFYNTSTVDVADLPNGIYFLHIKTNKGEWNKNLLRIRNQ